MPSKNPNNHQTRFRGKGVGLTAQTQALSIRFPPDVLEALRANPARQDFVRAAVIEKLERDALLPLPEITPAEVGTDTIEPPAPAPELVEAPKNTAKARKPMKPHWVTGWNLSVYPKLLSEQDLAFVQEHINHWYLVQEPKTKVSKWLEVKTEKEFSAYSRAERRAGRTVIMY